MTSSLLRLLIAVVLATSAGAYALTGESTCASAQSTSCRSTCLARYNQCRIDTKGSLICDQQYQSCLQSCLPGQR